MGLEQLEKLVSGKGCLPQDAFKNGGREVSGMDRNGEAQFGAGWVQQSCMAARLVVDIKTRALERTENLSGFEYRQF